MLVEAAYVLVVSAGRLLRWPNQGVYYAALAEAFGAGQLHLASAPHPALLKVADPTSLAHAQFWVGAVDTSLYQGRLYLYFGPVPGLLHLVIRSLFETSRFYGDTPLTFLFCTMALIAELVLIERLARRFAPDLPGSLVLLSMVAFGLSAPNLVVLASGGTYQAAIAGGHAFLMMGCVVGYDTTLRTSSRGIGRGLFLAGAAFALALGCRISLAPAIALLTVVLLHQCGAFLSFGVLVRRSVALGVPLGLGLGALLLYNHLRFDAWFDFGMRHQLTSLPFRFSLDHLLPNLHAYFTRLPRISCGFPYLSPTLQHGNGALSRWLPDPPTYVVLEPTVGLLILAPGLLLAAACLGLATRSARHFALLALGTSGLCALAPFGLYLATFRYTLDFAFGLLLVMLVGLGALLRVMRRHQVFWLLASGVVVVCLLVTATTGVLLGTQGYGTHFATHNPTLFARLEATLSLCRAR